MPKTVYSSEAKSRFGELVKWTAENQDKVVVKLYGGPAAVIMSYTEYEEVEKLRKREQKRKALEPLDALRQEARRQNPDLSAEEPIAVGCHAQDLKQAWWLRCKTAQVDARRAYRDSWLTCRSIGLQGDLSAVRERSARIESGYSATALVKRTVSYNLALQLVGAIASRDSPEALFA